MSGKLRLVHHLHFGIFSFRDNLLSIAGILVRQILSADGAENIQPLATKISVLTKMSLFLETFFSKVTISDLRFNGLFSTNCLYGIACI